MITSNYGFVKVTSNGIYGLDISLTSEVTEVINDVSVLEFDKVIESFKSNLSKELDLAKIDLPVNAMDGSIAEIMYY